MPAPVETQWKEETEKEKLKQRPFQPDAASDGA